MTLSTTNTAAGAEGLTLFACFDGLCFFCSLLFSCFASAALLPSLPDYKASVSSHTNSLTHSLTHSLTLTHTLLHNLRVALRTMVHQSIVHAATVIVNSFYTINNRLQCYGTTHTYKYRQTHAQIYIYIYVYL